MSLFYNYIRQFGVALISWWAFASLLLALVFVVLGFTIEKTDKIMNLLTAGSLCIGIFITSFNVWKKAYKDYSSGLSISHTEPALHAKSFSGIGVFTRCYIKFDINFSNLSNHECCIHAIQLDELNMANIIFNDSIMHLRLKITNDYHDRIDTSVEISKQKRKIIPCMVDIRFDNRNSSYSQTVAKNLLHLDKYFCSVSIVYSYPDGIRKTSYLRFQGDFTEFKEEMLAKYKEGKQHELLCLAHGIVEE